MPRPVPPAVVACVAGAATLALEVLLPRLVAPHLGTSVVVWTATLVAVLASLALGSAWGGRLADRRPGPRTAGLLLLAAGAWIAAVPLVDGALARLLEPWPLLPRALAGVLGTSLPAVLALGALSPALAREVLARGEDRAGRRLGALSAAGALGSLAGVYGTGFGLVPWVGTGTGLLAVAGALLLLGGATLLAAAGTAAPPAVRGAVLRPGGAKPLARGPAWALAAGTGAALLVIEVVAARVGARLVGQGLYTWTAVLGAVLLGLSIGGAIGGRLSDRGDPRVVLSRALLLASVATAASVWTPAALGALASSPGEDFPFRVALGAALAWLPACLALGAATPALVRAARGGPADDGRTVGALYAAQTAGCVAAALVTGPWLLPLLGPGGVTILAALGLALLVPVAGGRVERPFAVGLALLLAVSTLDAPWARSAGTALAVRSDADAVLVRESAYGQVRVDVPSEHAGLGRPRLRRLVLDGFVHGYTDLDDPDWLGYGYEGIYAAVTDRAAPAGRPVRALFLGGGACTFPRWVVRHRPGASVDVAEIDPVVTRTAKEALGLEDPTPFRVAAEDARTFVRDLPRDAPRYDLVYGDAFADLSVPWHLATREFTRAVRARMADDGVYLVNLVDSASSARFVTALAVTLRSVFAHVTLLALDPASERQETFVLVASDRALDLEGLERPDPARRGGKPRRAVVRWTDRDLEDLVQRTGARPLTDDFAPVETLLAPVVRHRTGR